MQDQAYLDGILRQGADNANEAATRTLDNVKQAMGFMPPL
jgi:tryptophanyl-tRNA synthetase